MLEKNRIDLYQDVEIRDGTIVVDSEEVGWITAEGCELEGIWIAPEHRGLGYGTEAIRQWVSERQGRCDRIRTTGVVSDTVQSVLRDLGFGPARGQDDVLGAEYVLERSDVPVRKRRSDVEIVPKSGGEYAIRVDGERAGVMAEMEDDPCRLIDMFISPAYQNEGVGTAATYEWIRRRNDCRELRTGPVVSQHMAAILEGAGFRPGEFGWTLKGGSLVKTRTDVQLIPTTTSYISEFEIVVPEHGKVGKITSTECKLQAIRVYRDHRGQGIGTAAFAEWLNRYSGQCDKLRTTMVVSPAMESILRDYGFRPREDGVSGYVRAF